LGFGNRYEKVGSEAKIKNRKGSEAMYCDNSNGDWGYVDVNSLRDRVSRQNIEEIKVKS